MTNNHAYTKLAEPITIRGHKIRNRILMGSMHVGFEDRFMDASKLAAFYGERAKGEAGLIVTGGIAPNRQGWLYPLSAKMTNRWDAFKHSKVTKAVHENDGKIVMQILHAGRYAYVPWSVSASRIKAPINPFTPWKLTDFGVKRTIKTYARAAKLARIAGYDGVEIMGGEGYFLNQFLAPRTNKRKDKWGGSTENRQRIVVEIVKAIRAKTDDKCLILFRLSMADLVEDGQTWDEIVQLAKKLEALGVDVITTDIGWHEARVPTIVTSVPRAAFVDVSAQIAKEVKIPVVASNRINTPEIAEKILETTDIAMVSLARPFLADPSWAKKSLSNQANLINTCIACNQACLDHAFAHKPVSCLVNPQAGRETELNMPTVRTKKRIAVIGAGVAGLACAIKLAERGHDVEVFEAQSHIGGQFAIAAQIPGKEEFSETIRYFNEQTKNLAIPVHLNTQATPNNLKDFDEIVIATGVTPRMPAIEGIDNAKVLSYAQAVNPGGKAPEIGKDVAVIGAGGIGFDISEFLTSQPNISIKDWDQEWGVLNPTTDPKNGEVRGQVTKPKPEPTLRNVTMLQRTKGYQGNSLNKTTGWVHRAAMKMKNVTQISGVNYDKIDDQGLHISDGENHENPRVIAVDNVIICAGQKSNTSLASELEKVGIKYHIIGGAKEAGELDAKRAIRQAYELANSL